MRKLLCGWFLYIYNKPNHYLMPLVLLFIIKYYFSLSFWWAKKMKNETKKNTQTVLLINSMVIYRNKWKSIKKNFIFHVIDYVRLIDAFDWLGRMNNKLIKNYFLFSIQISFIEVNDRPVYNIIYIKKTAQLIGK